MDADLPQQVAQLVLDELRDEGLTVRAIMAERRGEAVAVVVENDAGRRTVIVERRDGTWEVPQLLGGSPPSADGQRPRLTTHMRPFFDQHLKQSGWPKPDGGRPDVAWQALTGFAAEDAQDVIVSTDRDQPDGFFVTLARAPWGKEPDVRIRTRSGQLINVQM